MKSINNVVGNRSNTVSILKKLELKKVYNRCLSYPWLFNNYSVNKEVYQYRNISFLIDNTQGDKDCDIFRTKKQQNKTKACFIKVAINGEYSEILDFDWL